MVGLERLSNQKNRVVVGAVEDGFFPRGQARLGAAGAGTAGTNPGGRAAEGQGSARKGSAWRRSRGARRVARAPSLCG